MKHTHVVEAHGARIPAIGLGTWSLAGDECVRAVSSALEAGYRHIDTAANYGNEAEVGQALSASGVPRADVFVTTKVWLANLARDAFLASARTSCEKLGLDQVDLLLVHWPNPETPLAETIDALNEAKALGITRHIGVSNFPTRLFAEALRLSAAPIVCNQCEYHPRLDQSRVIAACRASGAAFTSYTPLGRGDLLDDPLVRDVARRRGRSPSQIVLRWHLQQPGIVAIPRSRSPAHIAANLDVFDFQLDEAEMMALSGLARPDGRVVKPVFSPQWDAAGL